MAIQFLNNVNADSGVLYVDAVNNKVGIGTTSPSRALQVIGTDGVAKFYYNSSFTNAQYSVMDVGMMTSGTAANGFGPKITFRMGGNGYDGYAAGAIGTVRNGADSTHNMTFATSSLGSMNTRMTITNGGLVGIGTTSPSATLHATGAGMGVKTHSSQSVGLEVSGGGNNQDIARFQNTSGSTKVTIRSSGDVGIGTTSPGAKLEVNGNSRFIGSMQLYNGSTSNQYLNILQSNSNTFINTGTSGETIYFGAPASNTTNIYVQGTITSTTISAATSDTDKFLVSDSGVIKYRTGAQLASDIGAVTGGPFLPLSGGTLTGDLTIPEYLYHSGDTHTNLRFESDAISLNAGGWKVFGNTTLKYGALYGDNSLRVYATQNGGYVNGSLEVNDYVEANAATDAYKGYIKQTVVSVANEKSASASYNLIPFNTITTTTANQYYNRMVAAYDGRVKKIFIRNTGASTPTATHVNFKKQVNDVTSSTVYTGVVANSASSGMSAYYDFANNDFTFSAGDTFGILYQTTDGFGTASRLMGGIAVTIILEYNIT
jgi:hypothetical protein